MRLIRREGLHSRFCGVAIYAAAGQLLSDACRAIALARVAAHNAFREKLVIEHVAFGQPRKRVIGGFLIMTLGKQLVAQHFRTQRPVRQLFCRHIEGCAVFILAHYSSSRSSKSSASMETALEDDGRGALSAGISAFSVGTAAEGRAA